MTNTTEKFKVRYMGESDPVYFIHGKIYDVIGIESGSYRVIDEEGEDYLYPPEIFEVIN